MEKLRFNCNIVSDVRGSLATQSSNSVWCVALIELLNAFGRSCDESSRINPINKSCFVFEGVRGRHTWKACLKGILGRRTWKAISDPQARILRKKWVHLYRPVVCSHCMLPLYAYAMTLDIRSHHYRCPYSQSQCFGEE